jgi:Protein of unknown function (DUF3592)
MNTISTVKSANQDSQVARLFAWLAVISGVMFFGMILALPPVHHRSASIHWPSTNGVVRAAGLKLYLHKSNIEPSYRPQIFYSYVVDGIPRVGARISFADYFPTFDKDAGIAWLDRNYPIGKTITVHYDPADPDFSVLEPGAKDLTLIWRWSAGSLAFCFLLALSMRSRALRRSNDPLTRSCS